MASNWRDREGQWTYFHEWEDAQLQSLPPDFSAALTWMSDAWELARRYDPDWDSLRSAEEHWNYLIAVRAALARLRLPS